MEENRFFRTVNRINSVLFLVILLGAGVSVLFAMLASYDWRQRQAVEVVDESAADGNKQNLRLGDLEEIEGHNIHYVMLETEPEDGKFSSRYRPSQVRNVLFFVGENLNYRWLYETHSNLVLCVCELKADGEAGHKGRESVIGLYIKAVKADTNGDGVLSEDDDKTLALANVDGSGYREVETGIKKVIDSDVTGNGRHLIFLVQVGREVVMKKYSLQTFDKVSERVITEISKSL